MDHEVLRRKPRRREWNTLPVGEFLTLSDAADLLCIKRLSLRSQIHSKVYRIPDYIEVVRDGKKVVGIRRMK